MNNADFEEKKSRKYARCVHYLSEIMTRRPTSILKNTVLVLIDLQSNPPKRPQSAANDVEGLKHCRLHPV